MPGVWGGPGEGGAAADEVREGNRAGPSREGLPSWAWVQSWEFMLIAVRIFS